MLVGYRNFVDGRINKKLNKKKGASLFQEKNSEAS
jgi:hypothetical protein